MTDPLVALESLTRTYEGSPPVRALRDVNLTVWPGDYLSIIGPSGSGKSTLLNILGCLDRPSAGRYLLDGIDVGGLSDRERTWLRGGRIGFVFQSFHLMPHRTALDNVAAAALYDGSPRNGRRRRAEDALRRVGLEHRLEFLPGKLSGGERQRVAMARAIMSRPRLLLCDEPTGNLDTATTESLLALFDELRGDDLSLFVITHDESVSARAESRVRIVDGVLSDA